MADETVGGFQPINTQEEFDARIKSRIDRLNRKSASELAAKQEELDKALGGTSAAETKLAKLQAELDSMKQASAISALKAKVRAETGVPDELLSGTDEEAMRKSAEAVLAFAKSRRQSAPSLDEAAKFAQDTKSKEPLLELANQLIKQ